MLPKAFTFIFLIFYTEVIAFNELHNQVSLEILEDGKNQYKLLQERGELPEYGECWKAAIEHIHNSCSHLTEKVQSDIALRITNCFLEMSGHETYNCDLDKKANLRGICINSMSDRAFNVYTEFYTHAQNICWFLHGHIWQEKMSELALHSSKQLRTSLTRQELLLQQQNDTLSMQQRILQYGLSLEQLLNESRGRTEAVMNDIQASTVEHRRLLVGLVDGLSGLQSWLLGEVSWFDTFLFYTGGIFVTLAITSAECTQSARLPLLLLLSLNLVLERTIMKIITNNINIAETHLIHEQIQTWIWWCRRFVSSLCLLVISIKFYYHRNYLIINNNLLLKVLEQNERIRFEVEKLKQSNSICDHATTTLDKSSMEVTNEKDNNGFIATTVDACSTPMPEEVFQPIVRLHRNTEESNSVSKASSRYNLRTRAEKHQLT